MKYYLFSLITFFLVSLLSAQNDVKGSIELVENFGDTVRFVKKEKNKILPIALPVTEPAVGYGLIGGMLYFIPKKIENIRPTWRRQWQGLPLTVLG